MGGSVLFVTFIDDFSRKAFVYPLKYKSEVFSTFVNFKNRVENETGLKKAEAVCAAQDIINILPNRINRVAPNKCRKYRCRGEFCK